MSMDPRTAPRAAVRELREATRQQTQRWSSGVGIVIAAIVAVLAIAFFTLLDYRFGQAPHRLIKIVLGLGVTATILFRPRVGLFLLPVVTPFLSWMPQLHLPGINVLNMLLLSVFVTWALYRVLNRQNVFRAGRLSGVLGIVVLLSTLSLVRGAAVPTGYQYEVRECAIELFRSMVTFAVYFIALAMARGPRDREILTWSVVLGLLAEALVTAAYGRNGKGGRAIGSFGQSNELGAFLAMYIVLAAAMLPAVRAGFARLVILFSVAAGTFGVLLSVSRGAILAVALGLFYVGFKSSRWLTFLLLAVMVTSPFWAPDYVKERMTTTKIEVEGTDEAELEGSAQARIDTWKATLNVVTDHPLDGVGFAGLQYVLPRTGEALGLEVKESSHNTYLRFLAEMGLAGLAAFCFLLWKCWRLGHEATRAATRAFDRQLAIGLSGATLVMAVSCAFGDRFFSILVTGNFWLACALVDDILIERRGSQA